MELLDLLIEAEAKRNHLSRSGRYRTGAAFLQQAKHRERGEGSEGHGLHRGLG
jgi:hypothetical protein